MIDSLQACSAAREKNFKEFVLCSLQAQSVRRLWLPVSAWTAGRLRSSFRQQPCRLKPP